MGKQSRIRRDSYNKANNIILPASRPPCPKRSGKVNPPRQVKAGNMQRRVRKPVVVK